MKMTFTDREIIEALKEGGGKEDRCLHFLYKEYKGLIQHFIEKNSGTKEEAKDVFQDALIAVYENIKSGKFKGESKLSSYLYSIARFMWFNRLKRKNIEWKIMDLQSVDEVEESHIVALLEEEKWAAIQGFFGELGAQCKRILIYSIYQGYNMKEISELMDYENEQVARNKKYKCLKKLKTLIAQRPEIIQLLKQE